jgi:hypothetical protein
MPDRVEPKVVGKTHIEAITRDGTHHHFTPRVLDVMLERDQVMRFKRSSGWVTVGIDPVRVKRRDDICCFYDGQERRTSGYIASKPMMARQLTPLSQL